MNIRLLKLSRIRSFSISTRAAIALTVAAVVTFESALFTTKYFAAARYLKENDPRKSGNLTDPLVFARPKLLRRGQHVRREELIDHFTRIGYATREGNEPGTFQVAAKTLRFNSRLPEFPSATLTFAGSRLAGIAVDSRSVDQVEVEPETLVPFMRLLSEEHARMLNQRRIVLGVSDLIPSILYDAVRASEDKRFETSSGIDEPGIARSVFKYLTGGFRPAGSGSGITQQLMKNSVLKDSDKTLDRKTREIFLSLAATRMMTRQEIFAAYANNVYLGHIENGPTLLGFEAAAREFFGKSVRDLSIEEAATLAGILDKPEVYLHAARNHDYSLLLSRRDRVLRLMHESFPPRYSAEMVAHAGAEPIQFSFTSANEPERALDLTSKPFEKLAADELPDVFAQGSQTGNLHIFTTIDADLQRTAYRAVNEQLSRLDAMVAHARRSLPLQERGGEPIQAALVAMDAQTGEILAMIGGRNTEFNYATAKRSPGSVIKVFVYLEAIAQGTHRDQPFTPATVIDPKNDPVDNYRPSSHIGQPATARTQLARSDNGAAVVTAHDAGLGSARELIARLTGSRSVEITGMLAIGGSAGCEVSALDLCEGYSVFPNNGSRITHTPFAAVYQDGKKIDLPRGAPERVIAGAPTFVLTQMMRSVLKSGGTASGALALAGLPGNAAVSGKTGTGQVSDLWFVGFSRRLIVAVWVGMPNNKPTLKMEQGFQGATTAMPIWASFIKNGVRAFRPDLLEGDFEMPAGVSALKIDPKRGCATDGPGVTEYFVAGREPRRCSK